MNMTKHYFLLIACIASLFFSCEDNDNSRSSNRSVNRWIYNEMSFVYLWNNEMTRKPNYDLSPETFFETLLYKRGERTGDRFSWIQENYVDLLNSMQGITPYDIGFEYVLYSFMAPYDYFCQIAYVKPNTDAERIGLKRGDIFVKVNDVALNSTNWRNVFSSSQTTAKITFLDMETGETTEKFVQKMVNYAENPVFFDNIYEVGGHKIGYLVYNFFASGVNNEDNSYDRELNEVFGHFKSAGITELVLDLRYNNGGSMNSAVLLGSMIVPDLNPNNVFVKLEFNAFLQKELVNEYGEDILIDKLIDRLETGETVNNVGNSIQKLYVLTGNWTASASELVINSLEPYMPGKIFLIGTNTVGKNVGSISIYEEDNDKNKWGMQPIILRYFNKEGTADFLNGFVPDIEEKDRREKLPLGDPDEVMLSIAINHITGGNTLRSATVDDRLPLGSSVEQKAWANKTIVDRSLLKKLNINR